MNFEEIVNNESILKAIADMGFDSPTEIQEKSIQYIRSGEDVIGQSQTGTGKTAAFAIPVLEKLDPDVRKPQVLILCPTRELSVQVAGEFRKLTKYLSKIKTVPVYGGEPIYKQINALKRGAQVIVGTPGRLIDHINRRTIRFDELHSVILDEADEMLKMGFREDIELILGHMDTDPQKILFSATIPREIKDLASKFMHEPKSIVIKSKGLTTSTVIQQYCAVKGRYKAEALYRFLDAKSPERCIVFCNTKRMVDEITDGLQERDYWSDKIHGDLKQELRMAVLQKFNSGVVNVLVATDVAARGLDIQNVDLVINYDIPEKEDYYVHRIGRSGRAGKAGEAITIASSSDRMRLHQIERYIKMKLDRIPVPSLKEVNERKKDAFIEGIIATMNEEGLEDYQAIVDKMINKGYEAKVLASALLKDALTLHDMVDENDLNDPNFNKRRNDSRDRRGDRSNNNRRGDRGGRDKERANKRNSRGQTRLFLSVGKAHKATVKDLLGAITGECRVSGRSIGAIDMYDKFSFVDVEDKYVNKVIDTMKDKRIKGRIINIEVAKS